MLLAITSAMGLLSLACSLVDSRGERQHRVARSWGRMLMAVFLVDVRVRGAERLDSGQPYVFASNHFSLIDTPLMFGFMPRSFRILARSGLWKIPFIGWHLDRAGHLPVDRANARRAARNISDAAGKVRAGRSILVFPEGGRRRSAAARPFKAGAAHIAIQAGVPIVPMAIAGTRRVLAPGSWHLRPGIVELRIGEPMRTDGPGGIASRPLTGALRAEIETLAAGPRPDGSDDSSGRTA